MDRLTERFSNGQAAVRGCGNNCKYDFKLEDFPTISEIYEKLAEYEDLEEQGKLLKLPCAVGDMVYQLIPTPIRNPARMGYRVNERTADNIYWIVNNIKSFNKTIFLTKPEAEQALQRMNEMEGKE